MPPSEAWTSRIRNTSPQATISSQGIELPPISNTSRTTQIASHLLMNTMKLWKEFSIGPKNQVKKQEQISSCGRTRVQDYFEIQTSKVTKKSQPSYPCTKKTLQECAISCAEETQTSEEEQYSENSSTLKKTDGKRKQWNSPVEKHPSQNASGFTNSRQDTMNSHLPLSKTAHKPQCMTSLVNSTKQPNIITSKQQQKNVNPLYKANNNSKSHTTTKEMDKHISRIMTEKTSKHS